MKLFLITAALLVATTVAATPASWLDQPVPDGWNTAGRPVPTAVRDPQAQGDPRWSGSRSAERARRPW